MQFPNLFRRYVASMIDVIVIVVLVGLIGNLPITETQNIPPVVIILIVLVAYEPTLSAFACTIGQLAMRIRVRRSHDRLQIGLGRAIARTFAKYMLGAASFLTMPKQREKRAMHDLLAGTLMLDVRDVK